MTDDSEAQFRRRYLRFAAAWLHADLDACRRRRRIRRWLVCWWWHRIPGAHPVCWAVSEVLRGEVLQLRAGRWRVVLSASGHPVTDRRAGYGWLVGNWPRSWAGVTTGAAAEAPDAR